MTAFILNTIAFKDLLDTGINQAELVTRVKDMGFNAIEIRNEYLTGELDELHQIAENAMAANLDVYYSINDILVVGSEINPKIDRYYQEMKALNSRHLKMNIGDLSALKFDLFVKRLTDLMDGSFELTLENNQTLSDSSLDTTRAFFQIISNTSLKDIHYCFDIANWKWLDAEPVEAAKALAPVTTYLHLKNMKKIDGRLEVTSLEEGEIDWLELLGEFTGINSMGLEYFGDPATIKQDLQRLKAVVN